MAENETVDFFMNWLPAKLERDPSLKEMNAVYVFEIKEAGIWTLRLQDDKSGVFEGDADDATCRITTKRKTWESILAKPQKAIQAFMMGKLKTNNVGQATKLQKILS